MTHASLLFIPCRHRPYYDDDVEDDDDDDNDENDDDDDDDDARYTEKKEANGRKTMTVPFNKGGLQLKKKNPGSTPCSLSSVRSFVPYRSTLDNPHPENLETFHIVTVTSHMILFFNNHPPLPALLQHSTYSAPMPFLYPVEPF